MGCFGMHHARLNVRLPLGLGHVWCLDDDVISARIVMIQIDADLSRLLCGRHKIFWGAHGSCLLVPAVRKPLANTKSSCKARQVQLVKRIWFHQVLMKLELDDGAHM